MPNRVRLPIAVSIISLFFIAISHRSFAQNVEKPLPQPIRMLAGGYFPSAENIRRPLGATFYSLGAAYDLYKIRSVVPAVFGVYFDYDTKSRSQETANVRLSNYGIGISSRIRLTAAAHSLRPYVGVGAGYYDVQIKASPVFSDENIHINENFSRFGGKFLAGCDITAGIFVEADYTFIGGIPATDPSGYRIRLGCRF